MEPGNQKTKADETAPPPAIYDTFDAFLQAAIKEYYDRGWQRPNFVALLLASGQTLSMAKDAVGSPEGLKRLALGTFGVMAARVLLTRIVTGPLGVILTGVSVASLVALLVRNQRQIIAKTGRFRDLITQTRERFDDAQNGYRQGRMELRERNLMIDGLLKHFLRDCDEI